MGDKCPGPERTLVAFLPPDTGFTGWQDTYDPDLLRVRMMRRAHPPLPRPPGQTGSGSPQFTVAVPLLAPSTMLLALT